MIETAERQENWIKDIGAGSELHLHKQLNDLGFKFQLQFNSSRTEAAKKPRGKAYFMTFGGSSEAKVLHLDQVVVFDLPPKLLYVFLCKKFMGILPGLRSISFTCISDSNNPRRFPAKWLQHEIFLEHGF